MECIYLDNHATTPVDPRVLEAMLPFFQDKFGNLASTHQFGRAVKSPVLDARKQVAQLINASADEIVFTSGATESDNLAIKGVAFGAAAIGRHIITCSTEHKAVIDTCEYLKGHGFAVTYLPVTRDGCIDPKALHAAIRRGAAGSTDRTVLVSLMHANNEIGTVHPIAACGAICREAGVVFHVDAAQSAGRIPIDVRAMAVDLLSLSAHKVYGPKGVGALFVRAGAPLIRLDAQMHGGGQENGFRSGTLPVPLVVGLGKACELARTELEADVAHARKLRALMLELVTSVVSGVVINGHTTERLPGNLHMTITGIDTEMLFLKIKNIACSTSSACSSASVKPSHVLKAIGLSDDEALHSIRFGIGRFNTKEEVEVAARAFADAVKKCGVRTAMPPSQGVSVNPEGGGDHGQSCAFEAGATNFPRS